MLSDNEIKTVDVIPFTDSSNPLIADICFKERFTSEALNRKFHGVLGDGIYQGFNFSVSGMDCIVGDKSGKNTAIAYTGGVAITVNAIDQVTVKIPAGCKTAVVLNVFYKIGMSVKQVDPRSKYDAATITAIPFDQVKSGDVLVCVFDVPAGTTSLTMAMSSIVGDNKTLPRSYKNMNKLRADTKSSMDKMNRDLNAFKKSEDKKLTDTTNKLNGDMSALTTNTDKKITDTTNKLNGDMSALTTNTNKQLTDTANKLNGDMSALTKKTTEQLANAHVPPYMGIGFPLFVGSSHNPTRTPRVLYFINAGSYGRQGFGEVTEVSETYSTLSSISYSYSYSMHNNGGTVVTRSKTFKGVAIAGLWITEPNGASQSVYIRVK